MKLPRIANALENIDDALIEEAVSYKPKKNRIPVWTKFAAAAACICLCMTGIFFFLHPGTGRTEYRHPVTAGETVWFSTGYGKHTRAYCWNLSMQKPEKLGIKGRFFDTESGPLLYDYEEEFLYTAGERGLSPAGTAKQPDFLDNAAVIGMENNDIYWSGEHWIPDELFENQIVRTSLNGYSPEVILAFENSSLLSCTLRSGKLYYHISVRDDALNSVREELRVKDVKSGEDILLAELPRSDSGITYQSLFLEDCIILSSDWNSHSLLKMSYEGGEPELLSNVVPYNHAADEKNRKLYFGTSLGDNGPEAFVSVDLESGEMSPVNSFPLENKGSACFTIFELAMTEEGFYFTDPQKGLYYHSFADGSTIHVK